MCLYASSLLDRIREMRLSLSFVSRISIGRMGAPGREVTLKEEIRLVASMNSRSRCMREDCFATPRLVM